MLTLSWYGTAVARVRKAIADNPKGTLNTAEDVARFSADMDMDFRELASFQNLKSIHSEQLKGTRALLSRDLAQYLYRVVGEGPGVFNAQRPEVKVVVNQIHLALVRRDV